MRNNPVVQLSNVTNFSVIFTALQSPVWRAKLWVDPYVQKLPFMVKKSKYSSEQVVLANVVINFEEYLKIEDFELLRKTAKTWMLDPADSSVLYIHFDSHNPPFVFMSLKGGALIGFTHGKSLVIGELKTYPALLDFPEIEDKADNFTYQKMKFASGNVSIDNSTGLLDDLLELFGNDLNLLNYTGDKVEIVRQFFISQYSLGLKKATFSVMDKRSRLTFKAPNTFYTKEEFPFIEENLLDKVIQDAYGYCRGVEGVCLNRNQVYKGPSYQPLPEDHNFNDWFIFKFARSIKSVEEILVNKSDVWTQVFPGLGVPGNDEGEDYYQNPHPLSTTPCLIIKDLYGKDELIPITEANKDNLPANDGRIAIWWRQALKHNPGFLENRNGNAEKVKMSGVFVDINTPGEIVLDMMTYYGELPHGASYFNYNEWPTEILDDCKIGICLNKSDNIYNWIEKIQNGSLLGFQLLVDKNLFAARVDNPNKGETFDIKWQEIINRDALETELNGENYATYTKINYLFDYVDDEWKTVIDQSKRLDILDVYKYEKEYENNCYLTEENDVVLKGNVILENFMSVKPVIRGIELMGLREDDIKLFSTGYIDFTVELPRHMKTVQKFMKNRENLGKLRVKVIGVKRNLKTDRVVIDVQQQDYVKSLPLYYADWLLINGMNSDYENYEYLFYPPELGEEKEVDYIFNGGNA